MVRRRVLVVDDNADIANLTALLLNENGCEVITASDGQTALRTAQRYQPEVVFLDLHLPGVDGIELARQLRATLPGPVTLVIFSGYVDPGVRQRAAEAGVDAVVAKQGDLDALERALVSFLAQPRPDPTPILGP